MAWPLTDNIVAPKTDYPVNVAWPQVVGGAVPGPGSGPGTGSRPASGEDQGPLPTTGPPIIKSGVEAPHQQED